MKKYSTDITCWPFLVSFIVDKSSVKSTYVSTNFFTSPYLKNRHFFCWKWTFTYHNNVSFYVCHLFRPKTEENFIYIYFFQVLWLCYIPSDQKSKQRISLPLKGLKIIIGLHGDSAEKYKQYALELPKECKKLLGHNKSTFLIPLLSYNT